MLIMAATAMINPIQAEAALQFNRFASPIRDHAVEHRSPEYYYRPLLRI